MDDQQPKPAKITVRIDYADGTSDVAQAVEPDTIGVDIAYPLPDIDLSDSARLTAFQPPPVITVSFQPGREHGWTQRHISRAENEAVGVSDG